MVTYCSPRALHPSRRMFFSCCFAACLITIVGCGGDEGPVMYPVTGTVTFDGSPVDEGRIQFTPTSGARAFSTEIKDGEYSVDAEPGKMKVEITASRIIPGKFDNSNPDDDPQPVGEMYIPAVYNSKTTLEAEVTDGENEFPFDLKNAK